MAPVATDVHPSAASTAPAPRTTSPSSLAGYVVRGVILATLLAIPWFFGGGLAASQVYIFGALIVAVLAALFAPARQGVSWAAIPLFGGIVLAGLQMAPGQAVPFAWWGGPNQELRRELTHDEPPLRLWNQPQASWNRQAASTSPLSLNPAATRRRLALLLLATAAFILAGRFFSSGPWGLGLCFAACVTGIALVFFGLVQYLTWNGMLYWSVPLSQGGVPFGPFVNRNHAAGWLNMCLAGALGCLVWAFSRSKHHESPDDWHSSLGMGHSTWDRLREGIANLNATKLAASCGVIFLIVGILATFSRGGVLAMLGAAILVAAVFMTSRREARPIAMILVLACGALLVVSWLGLLDPLQARLSRLMDAEVLQEKRPLMWRDAWEAARDFGFMGSGLGTFRYLFEMYRFHLPDELWFEHAENQYLETLIEAGAVGVLLLLAAIAGVGYSLWRLSRRMERLSPAARGLAVAAAFAWASQVIHAAFDFGLYLPANMLMLATFTGAAVGLREGIQRKSSQNSNPVVVVPWFSKVVLAGVAASLMIGWMDVRRLAAIETVHRASRRQVNVDHQPAGEIQDDIQRLTEATRDRWDDAEAHLRLAELWTQQFRIEMFGRLRLEADPRAADEALWQLTALSVLHDRAQPGLGTKLAEHLDELRTDPSIASNLYPATRHLLLARQACPLMAKAHLGLAELAFLTNSPASEATSIRRACRLAPSDARLQYHAGVLDWNARRTSQAAEAWRRSWQITSEFEDEILRQLAKADNADALFEKLLPDRPEVLVGLAETYAKHGEHPQRQALLRKKADEALAKVERPTPETYQLRGKLAWLMENDETAVEQYRRALLYEPTNLRWRYELAQILHETGDLEEAYREAKWCLDRQPRYGDYRNLVKLLQNEMLQQGTNTD